MAKTDNLIDYLTDIADAIREKKGTSDLINAQNFADEIKNMPQNGEGGEPGGDTGVSSWKYYDISAFGDSIQQAAPMIIGLFHIMKCGGTQKGIYPCGVEISSSGLMYLMVAAGVDMSAPIYAAGFERIMTMEEYLSKSSLWAQCFQTGMVEITEEEFYNLNA